MDKNILPAILPNAPAETQRLIDFLANPNLTTVQIDQEMGFPAGETRRLISRYPALAKKAQEARLMAFRLVGIDSPRLKAYTAIKDALEAEKSQPCGANEFGVEYEKVADHKIRLEAAQKILKILGDDSIADINIENLNIGADALRQMEHYKAMTVEELMAEADKILKKKAAAIDAVIIEQARNEPEKATNELKPIKSDGGMDI